MYIRACSPIDIIFGNVVPSSGEASIQRVRVAVARNEHTVEEVESVLELDEDVWRCVVTNCQGLLGREKLPSGEPKPFDSPNFTSLLSRTGETASGQRLCTARERGFAP